MSDNVVEYLLKDLIKSFRILPVYAVPIIGAFIKPEIPLKKSAKSDPRCGVAKNTIAGTALRITSYRFSSTTEMLNALIDISHNICNVKKAFHLFHDDATHAVADENERSSLML